MRKSGLVICFVFLLLGCNDKDGIPSGILGKEKMRKVFWELIQQDVFVNQFVTKDSTKKPLQQSVLLQNKIFYLNHTTKEEFYRSYGYYKSHPELMKVILDSMSVTSERERNKLFPKK